MNFLNCSSNRGLLRAKINQCRKCRLRQFTDLRIDYDEYELERMEIIFKLKLSDLKDLLACGEFYAVDVLHAYQMKALEIHEKTNCICYFINNAEQWARELDETFSHSAAKQKILYGIPISVNESIAVKGHDSTFGFVNWLDEPCSDSGVIIKAIRDAGGIPFCVTNIAQAMMSCDCSNPIYGTTTHPKSSSMTPGGSSGGEAALIASGGSVLGVGTDLWGSLRIPAHFTGICSFKPHSARVSNRGSRHFYPGLFAVPYTIGPMSRDVQSLVMFCKAVFGMPIAKHDCYASRAEFDQQQFVDQRPLRIGFYDIDDFCAPVRVCQRAVAVAKEALEAAGHQLIPFRIPDVTELMMRVVRAIFPDGGAWLLKQLDNDIVSPSLKQLHLALKTPRFLNRLISYYDYVLGQSNSSKFSLAMSKGESNLSEVFGFIEEYKLKIEALWKEEQLDGLICPVFGVPAVRINEIANISLAASSHTVLFNVLDYPAGVLPCTNITEADCAATPAASGTVGFPAGVQCVGTPYSEETVLRIMYDIERFTTGNK